jgi:hypothetical protein
MVSSELTHAHNCTENENILIVHSGGAVEQGLLCVATDKYSSIQPKTSLVLLGETKEAKKAIDNEGGRGEFCFSAFVSDRYKQAKRTKRMIIPRIES